MIRAIIPCCGYGTRMNMHPNQSKEMLLESNGKYVIEYSMELCKKFNLNPLFIVRPEKEDLINYLKNNNLETLVITPGKEWAETVFKSKDHWQEHNILLLPDTRFQPESIIDQIRGLLEFGSEVCFAVHKVEEVSKWGFVTGAVYSEKPLLQTNGYAWGIIGFTKKAGSVIFKNMQSRHTFFAHEFLTNFVLLNDFKDITRTGILE